MGIAGILTNNEIIQARYLLLIFLIVDLTLHAKGGQSIPSVNLTVEGGVSLVGPHCPGTVRLFCEGVDLTLFRWRYNDTIDLRSFDTVDLPTNVTLQNPAFINISLSKVHQTPGDSRFANFSSVLTVNLQGLQDEGVTSISCGDPGNIDVKLVNVQIIEPTVPDMPTIHAVTAIFESGSLQNIMVLWRKLLVECPEFEGSLVHELSFSGLKPVQVSQTSCENTVCAFTYSPGGNRTRLTMSLMTRNSVGASDTYIHPEFIERREQYFTPKLLITCACDVEIECMPARTEISNSTCTVEYYRRIASMNQGNQITTSFNTPFSIQLTPNTEYSFQFSVVVSDTLTVIESMQISTETNLCSGLSCDVRLIAVSTALAVTFALLVITLLILLWKVCRSRHRLSPDKDNSESSRQTKAKKTTRICCPSKFCAQDESE